MAARGGCELLDAFLFILRSRPSHEWDAVRSMNAHLIWAVDIGHKMIDLLLIRAENFSAFGRWQRHSRDCWLSEAF